ncbi:hypothetical protein BCY88_18665 [Paraburkholderia fungorum]|uniref:Uncharacterized protein n=1 Tax=Paraburkholderia fungorum TaxID=134537 RepID=A0A3R7E922_9BURK|nr:hypothetical protein BCY88_18665 [Paraburkholderia fungorum]
MFRFGTLQCFGLAVNRAPRIVHLNFTRDLRMLTATPIFQLQGAAIGFHRAGHAGLQNKRPCRRNLQGRFFYAAM